MTKMVGEGISRREFFTATAVAGAAAFLTGGFRGVGGVLPTAGAQDVEPDAGRPWFDASIRELQHLMATGQLSSRELTQHYLDRIARLNPLLHAVIETNPDALQIAARLDAERRNGHVRGTLHGIPIIVKDNIATADKMETTAGSLALVGSVVPEDATVVARLRRAGAVILGKANLSEWANFRGNPPPDFDFNRFFLNGWSARGGFTHDPYLLSFDPCGSSSGSGAAPAANFCAGAIGTETDGSIVCPSGNNLITGIKPTLHLIPQDGIIPISHNQDSAGPMARSVTDVAIILNHVTSSFLQGHRKPHNYLDFLTPDALRHSRIGIERRLFRNVFIGDPSMLPVIEDAIEALRRAGATIIDPVDTGDPFEWFDAEFTVLLFDFKVDIRKYLSTLRHTSMRTLADLIRFNRNHCEQEMKYFGQEVFLAAEATSGNLSDPEYVRARQLCIRLGRGGINRVMREHNLDAVLSPSYGSGSSAPAIAGFPVMCVPVGFTNSGKPVGVYLYAGFMDEPKLLKVAYGIEQLLQVHRPPHFAGHAPPPPPDAGICESTVAEHAPARTRASEHRIRMLHAL